jgi:hypothetical protein
VTGSWVGRLAAGVAALSLGAAAAAALAAPGEELPGGGTKVFDDRRVVAFYGAPQSKQLGVLGIGSPRKAGRRLERMARRYERAGDREVLPAMELIAVIALSHPGPGGKFRGRQSPSVIKRYLRAARRIDALLLLDIQPGRSSFTDEVKALEPFLRQPRVGIAIDPEWNMGLGGVPGERVGHVGAREVNRVSLLMNRIAAERDLPQKVLVVHQFTESMVRHDNRIKARGNVAVTMNADGFGSPGVKERVYEQLAPRGGRLHPGFKLFFHEDTNLMSAKQVLRLNPAPELVIYE